MRASASVATEALQRMARTREPEEPAARGFTTRGVPAMDVMADIIVIRSVGVLAVFLVPPRREALGESEAGGEGGGRAKDKLSKKKSTDAYAMIGVRAPTNSLGLFFAIPVARGVRPREKKKKKQEDVPREEIFREIKNPANHRLPHGG